MEEYKYCAFIDVLGYGNLVRDSAVPTAEKIRMLNSIYTNLATQFINVIHDINAFYTEKIYIRSFSDCFYLDCAAPEQLLIAVKSVYENVFGFYANFTEQEERTPLLRCGIVKDWLIKFNDIGGLLNHTSELNPIGLSVARAYHVSEKTKLSGMKIIISPEVITDLNVSHLTIPEFECYVNDMATYNVTMRYYFKHITVNEDNQPTDLYEMLWPFDRANDHAYQCIDTLIKIKRTIPVAEDRQFKKTLQLFIDSYCLSSQRTSSPDNYQRDLKKLQDLL